MRLGIEKAKGRNMDLETVKVEWDAPAILYENPDALEKGFGWASKKHARLDVAIGMFVRLSGDHQRAASIGIDTWAIEGSSGMLGLEEVSKLYRRPDFPKEAVDHFLD
jgi:hypothetical protein